MKEYILDLHVHSKYSRATSKYSDLETLEQWGKIKGIDILGTGDFTHPAWYREIESKLESNGNGLFTLKQKSHTYPEFLDVDKWGQHDRPFYFMLTTEISCIYKRHGKARRVHVCLWVPTIEAVQKIITKLDAIGNLKHDGRPILGLDVEELTKIVLDADERSLVVPAHIWTPWFALFGSKSGFDSLEECFGEMIPYIYAAETGLSSDPPMNWRVKDLDHLVLVSNSDAHSVQNIGREANVVSLSEPSYYEFYDVIKNRDLSKFKYTVEFFPEEGKYHMDGHATCQFVCSPEETVKRKGLCRECGKKLTVGVMHRVHDLASRKNADVDKKKFAPFKSIVPLAEILSDVLGKKKNTKTVLKEYFKLIAEGNNEFDILLHSNLHDFAWDRNVIEAIERVRSGDINVKGGYDGVYGTVEILTRADRQKQTTLL